MRVDRARVIGRDISIGSTVTMITLVSLCVMHGLWWPIALVLAAWVLIAAVGMLIAGEPAYQRGSVAHVTRRMR